MAGGPGRTGTAGRRRATVLTHTIRDFRAAFAPAQRVPTAVVMTMGALHEGHATLIRTARRHVGEEGRVAVTVFVNPLQFGPGEDLDRYPRTLDADLAMCRDEGVDVVFAPSAQEMYPGGEPRVRVAAGPMGERLEGEFRPGHFDGMLTVVLKLFHITRPDAAFFGQKDAQQLALIRAMAADLDLDIDVVAVPTVREPDGLALSSRNRYLSPEERSTALALSRALFAGRDAAAAGAGADAVRAAAAGVLAGAGDGLVPDYLALVDPADFTEVPAGHTGDAVLAVAARVGTTRLIDNVPLRLHPLQPPRTDS